MQLRVLVKQNNRKILSTQYIEKSMLNKVPYSKAQFRQAIVLTLSLVALTQLSSSVDALPAEQDATKEKREAPDATSAISSEEGGGRKCK